MLPGSLEHVLRALNPREIIYNSKVTIGDARNMNQFSDNLFDVIITSPPYLNAIDYMRGHKFSLVWLGFSIPTLRNISSSTIGSEKKIPPLLYKKHIEITDKNEYCLDNAMIQRYFIDLYEHLHESFRVLKSGGKAFYVIGNSNIKGGTIFNNILLKDASKIIGYELLEEDRREIPSNRRYMPINGDSTLSKRMKTEYVITLGKP
jgi:DNA modification methylase